MLSNAPQRVSWLQDAKPLFVAILMLLALPISPALAVDSSHTTLARTAQEDEEEEEEEGEAE